MKTQLCNTEPAAAEAARGDHQAGRRIPGGQGQQQGPGQQGQGPHQREPVRPPQDRRQGSLLIRKYFPLPPHSGFV